MTLPISYWTERLHNLSVAEGWYLDHDPRFGVILRVMDLHAWSTFRRGGPLSRLAARAIKRCNTHSTEITKATSWFDPLVIIRQPGRPVGYSAALCGLAPLVP